MGVNTGKAQWMGVGLVAGFLLSQLAFQANGGDDCGGLDRRNYPAGCPTYCPACVKCKDGKVDCNCPTVKRSECPVVVCPKSVSDCPEVKCPELPEVNCPEPAPCPDCPKCEQQSITAGSRAGSVQSAVRSNKAGEDRTDVHHFSPSDSPLVHIHPTGKADDGEWLGLVQPTIRMKEGKIAFPKTTKGVALDIGTSLWAPSSQKVLRQRPDVSVLAFEPNVFSYSLITHSAHPGMGYHPKQWFAFSPKCRMIGTEKVGPTLDTYYTNCVNKTWYHVSKNLDNGRFTPNNAAMSNSNRFATFQMGVKDPGTGSLYKFRRGTEWSQSTDLRWGERRVPVIRLDSVMKFIPDDIAIEMVKIDAQGHDSEVVMGIGEVLKRVKCLIGEFDTEHYQTEDNKVAHVKLLKQHGFITMQHSKEGAARGRMPRDDQVYINTRFEADFRAENYICLASDVHIQQKDVIKALDRWKKLGR